MEEEIRPEAAAQRPALGEVMAVEAIAGARSNDRRSTRDPERVGAVVKALEAATWSSGGMPRCPHVLFIRLVPPSGEGGITAFWCSPSTEAHAWVPGEGAFVLDEAGSAALWEAAHPIGQAEGGPILPVAITDNPSTFSLSAGVREAEEGQLQSVELYTSQRLEPAPVAADGSPLVGQHTITAEQALEVAQALDRQGFFARARHFHSPVVDAPTSPPPQDSTEAPGQTGAPAWIEVTVTAGEWHRTWREEAAGVVLRNNLKAVAGLEGLGEAGSQLTGLAERL